MKNELATGLAQGQHRTVQKNALGVCEGWKAAMQMPCRVRVSRAEWGQGERQLLAYSDGC